jgi:opacity protein-like surface antigen
MQRIRVLSLLGLLLVALGPARAAVLPEDRADALYHRYDGGGVTIHGPSILVRKSVGKSVSLAANYYVDTVSSASIDVVTTASRYDEERTQKSVSGDFLYGSTIFSAGYTNSDESDYEANTAYFGVSQDIFGALTNISMGYSRGWDTVGRSGDADFSENVDRQTYALGISQILTRNWLVGLSLETITDEGFLNNPYRSVRYVDPDSARGYSYQSEIYPNTRTSTAVALRSRYYLPFRAALHTEYRFFTDTWGINAHTGEVGFTHPVTDRWIVDLKYRYYTQTAADFYSDLFSRQDAQNYMARDKEMSEFDSHTLGVGLSYEFLKNRWKFLERGSFNVNYDYLIFDYHDFRDLRVDGVPAGTEPLYDLNAYVLQIFLSVWF